MLRISRGRKMSRWRHCDDPLGAGVMLIEVLMMMMMMMMMMMLMTKS